MQKPQRSDDQKVDLFLANVADVLGRRAVRQGLKTSWDWKLGLPFSDRGDEEDLRSLVLTLRKFVASGEDVFLHKCLNLLRRRVSSEDRLCEEIDALKHDWELAQKDTQYPHGQDAARQELTPISCFEMWTNGFLFHDDQACKAKYMALSRADQVEVDMLSGRLIQNLVIILIRAQSIVWAMWPPPGYLPKSTA